MWITRLGSRPYSFSRAAWAFVASVAATVYFCRSMCCEMEMPCGWTMSMMWMRMHGQTWFGSALSFHFMWLAMMVAMMLPSALPTFLKQRRTPASLSVMATGYFAAWMALGVGIYALGVAFAAAAMRWEVFSRAVPVLSGASLIAAGPFNLQAGKPPGCSAAVRHSGAQVFARNAKPTSALAASKAWPADSSAPPPQ